MQKNQIISVFITACLLSVVVSDILFKNQHATDAVVSMPLTISIQHDDSTLSTTFKLTLDQTDSPSNMVSGLANVLHVQTQLWMAAATTAVTQSPQLILDFCGHLVARVVND
ncbi:hypothetical protein GCM10008090_03840 [Arenicella chitinivorans]|uniref:Uncharacterized protein n=1 Tax=Arenicella chitinivorans TaxID=1329800 RepID=A0A918VHP5_9GAMM|nr:hypothetical protein [Arenicella chitinivorans]GGZ98569.1 hypothetical protein GCM10008090_03840 [Arenicella chitinivorans]